MRNSRFIKGYKKTLFYLILLLIGNISVAQIIGTVTDTKNNFIPFVNIFVENSYTGTTTNDDGYYELNLTKKGKYTVVFSCLGYRSLKKEVTINNFPYTLKVTLQEVVVSLKEVVVNASEDPAIAIMRQAIAKRIENLKKFKSYTADFYSKGLIKIKDAPKKILGQKVGDFDGALDSTRTGIIYLSETISKIKFLSPNLLKEKITASKIAGNNNGFSFNNAHDVNFNLYQNTIQLGTQVISPIANNAFTYYRYKLDGVFYDEYGNSINKIKVIPKRKNDPVFSGYIYIVENQWNIYATELDVTGNQVKMPGLEVLSINQNFSYSETDKLWALISQAIDFEYDFLGFKGGGRFTAVYSNYKFNFPLIKKEFGNELVGFEKKANKKDSIFWNTVRPVPLTLEESKDYVKKDSIQTIRRSKTYLDSIDQKNNKFKISNILGYTYENSYKNITFNYDIPLRHMAFNTVQGFTVDAKFYIDKAFDKNYNRYFNSNTTIQYGFSDKRLRATGNISYKFNNINKALLTLSGGISSVVQFNDYNPITKIVNTVTSLFSEENYLKLYERDFMQLDFSQELFNGFNLYLALNYQERRPLFNTTDQVWFPKSDKMYTSNNPLNANAFGTSPFETHHIVKVAMNTRIRFGQKYFNYPNAKYNIPSNRFPTLNLGYEKGFASTNPEYHFDQIKASLSQSFSIKDKGRFRYRLKAGKFFNADRIAFMDYHHFNGNQTHISTKGNYTNVFNNLKYYALSTRDSYFETHIEHDFEGFLLGKTLLLNALNFNLILGTHLLTTPQISPYQEYTIGVDNIGWGNWRFLRIDYVRSYQAGFVGDAIVFGLKFF